MTAPIEIRIMIDEYGFQVYWKQSSLMFPRNRLGAKLFRTFCEQMAEEWDPKTTVISQEQEQEKSVK